MNPHLQATTFCGPMFDSVRNIRKEFLLNESYLFGQSVDERGLRETSAEHLRDEKGGVSFLWTRSDSHDGCFRRFPWKDGGSFTLPMWLSWGLNHPITVLSMEHARVHLWEERQSWVLGVVSMSPRRVLLVVLCLMTPTDPSLDSWVETLKPQLLTLSVGSRTFFCAVKKHITFI